MQTYLNLMQHVLQHGIDKSDHYYRNGHARCSAIKCVLILSRFSTCYHKEKTASTFHHSRTIGLRVDTNIAYLVGVSIWDDWAGENGDWAPFAGYQWRSWPTPNGQSIDQISQLIHQIKTNQTQDD